jgi:hypothetical protein
MAKTTRQSKAKGTTRSAAIGRNDHEESLGEMKTLIATTRKKPTTITILRGTNHNEPTPVNCSLSGILGAVGNMLEPDNNAITSIEQTSMSPVSVMILM